MLPPKIRGTFPPELSTDAVQDHRVLLCWQRWFFKKILTVLWIHNSDTVQFSHLNSVFFSIFIGMCSHYYSVILGHFCFLQKKLTVSSSCHFPSLRLSAWSNRWLTSRQRGFVSKIKLFPTWNSICLTWNLEKWALLNGYLCLGFQVYSYCTQ